MPNTDPFDPQQIELFQALAQALIEYVPEHFTSAFCRVEQAPGHGQGRLQYRIGSTAFPNDDTPSPSQALHEAAFELYRYWTKGGQPFPGFELKIEQENDRWKTKMELLHQGKPEDVSDTAQERLWDAVYAAREEFYRSHFGPLPNDIQKLMNLTGIWPGGGLFQYTATAHHGLGICTSFGLSNVDMPTPVGLGTHERTEEGGKTTFTSKLQGRVPRHVPAERAGYGYELAILTPTAADWTLLPVSWFVQMEILKDLALLERVMAYEGMTMEALKIGDGSETADFLIQPAAHPYPDQVQLPNGTMRLLIATRITREEMNFSMQQGRALLLDRLTQAGVGQMSILDRESVVS